MNQSLPPSSRDRKQAPVTGSVEVVKRVEHSGKCASFKPKYSGDQRNTPGGDARQDCDCDGYHTFDELYEHRIALFIALCKQIKQQPYCDEDNFGIWRSRRHSDGSMFNGWFIAGIARKKGMQISYHLPNSQWENIGFAETLNNAPEFDGHTPDDVLERIKTL